MRIADVVLLLGSVSQAAALAASAPRRGSSRVHSRTARMSAPAEALPDIVVPTIDSTEDERLWVPQTECLSFRCGHAPCTRR